MEPGQAFSNRAGYRAGPTFQFWLRLRLYKKKAGSGYATVSKKIQNANFSGVSNVLLSELDAKL